MQKSIRFKAAFAFAIVTLAAAANSFALPAPKTMPFPKCPTSLVNHAVPTPKSMPFPKCPTSLR